MSTLARQAQNTKFTQAVIAVIGLLSAGAFVMNAIWLFVLAMPFAWLWNRALVPIVHVPEIGFWRSFGLLLLCHIIVLAGSGIKMAAKLRDRE